MDDQILLLTSSSSYGKDDPSLIKKKYDICLSSLNKYMYENLKLTEELNNLESKNNDLKNILDQKEKINKEEIFKKDITIIKLEHKNCELEIQIKDMEKFENELIKLKDENKKLNELNLELETRINTKLNSAVTKQTLPIFTKKNTISHMNYDHDKLNDYRKLNDDENKNENKNKFCCLIS